MSEEMDRVQPCDVRLFRDRAREERRRVGHAGSERARIVHEEMAEHYETVADLLEAKADWGSDWPGAAWRRMLRRLLPR
ncbi:hypothetical protein OK349_00675 [Sphingomonas sp. BT-65]|uniref:hypothetical protein n=1 Tax=Sphingomonas sp. BT-65 TaxID=2989821 RepID=UPI00223640C6|nr:hypothetical protein [Sphingomonas sp. BT-65]MCW4460207.1 hypothetical protein [Sphingomonas sp. BT-65]